MEIDNESWHALDTDPPGPTAIDVAKAMADGKRRRRVRGIAGLIGAAAAATAVLVAVPVAISAARPHRSTPDRGQQKASSSQAVNPPASGTPTQAQSPSGPPHLGLSEPTSCSIHRLPTPSGVTMAITAGGDPTGHYLVGRSYHFFDNGSLDEVPAIWHDGQLTSVQINGGDPDFWDVNSSGDAVGVSYPDGLHRAAWYYHDGVLSRLEGTDAEARGINNGGLIVGQSLGKPVVWSAPTLAPTPTPLSKDDGEAYGIDETGTIAGTLGDNRAVVWYPDGSIHDLAIPAGYSGGRAFGIQAGWAYGRVTGGPGDTGARWNVRTGAVRIYPELESVGGVSQEGWVIGATASGYPVIITDTTTITMPVLTGPKDRLDNIPNSISLDGRTVGGQAVLGDKKRTYVAVSWQCS